jgi:hypothetical protein
MHRRGIHRIKDNSYKLIDLEYTGVVVILLGITSSWTNLPKDGNSAGNHQIMEEESTGNYQLMEADSG